MHRIILSSADGYSDCFPILAIMNNATTNMRVAGIFWYPVFICSEYVPRVKLLDYMIVSLLALLRNLILFSILVKPVYTPTNNVHCTFFPACTHPCQYLSFVFLWIAILTSVKWFIVVVLICISLISGAEPLSCICWPFLCLHWKKKECLVLPVFKSDILGVCCCWRCVSLYILDMSSLSDKRFTNVFSHCISCLLICWVLLSLFIGFLVWGNSSF